MLVTESFMLIFCTIECGWFQTRFDGNGKILLQPTVTFIVPSGWRLHLVIESYHLTILLKLFIFALLESIETEIFHLPQTPGLGWPQPRAWNPIWISAVDGKNPSTWAIYLQLLRVCTDRKITVMELGLTSTLIEDRNNPSRALSVNQILIPLPFLKSEFSHCHIWVLLLDRSGYLAFRCHHSPCPCPRINLRRCHV